MSRKGNSIDNAATEQAFGYLKDEFYIGREFGSYKESRLVWTRTWSIGTTNEGRNDSRDTPRRN
ncbi:integrase core domain protein [Bifidobacterium saguini DSM 23967]|uniref:Integrase core domain protein n=1 Tax=Bifidobacterium saguini DSM 23967 TaxID=1437607 RepID=A0A087DA42_9BIFI|nr:integrase core domain protein [Bifidobacterium saguini DSM 23967]